MTTRSCLLILLLLAPSCWAETGAAKPIYQWNSLPELPNEHGVAGPFAGVHNDVLIVAGGANFPAGLPWHPTKDGGKSLKNYISEIYTLDLSGASGDKLPEDLSWELAENKLPSSVAYGVSIATDNGIICIGGESQEHRRDGGKMVSTTRRSDRVYALMWDAKEKRLEVSLRWYTKKDDLKMVRTLPALPVPTTAASGARIGDYIYVVGGDTGQGGSRNFWRLDLSQRIETGEESQPPWQWERLPSWNGQPRSHAVAVEQMGQLFLISGRNKLADQPFQILTDAHRFDPAQYERETRRAESKGQPDATLPSYANGWTQIADVAPDGESPRSVMAGTGWKVGFDFVAVFGGARGDVLLEREENLPRQIALAENAGNADLASRLKKKADELYDNHKGFSRDILTYHLTTNRWTKRGELPVSSPVTTTAVAWRNSLIIPSGERSPGVRTRDVLIATRVPLDAKFGSLNWAVLGGYLAMLVLLGVYFARREASSQDFFLASGRVPWWAAGLSIFATMLSAITYLSIPARAYGTNWSWLLLNLGIPVISIVAAYLYLPFFRRLTVASAYEYLERRFHISLRVFGSVSFVLFQLGRMGIVVLLPALALSAVTGLSVLVCIMVMGVLSTLYTVLGGIEAVVWTDVLQTFVLVGGAIAALFAMAAGVDGGFRTLISTAWEADKFGIINDFHTHDLSWARDGIVVILLGAIFTNLLPYTSDQSVIQRYLTTADEKKARAAIFTNGILSVPAAILFFLVGTALWSFYRLNPQAMTPLSKSDQVFPWFIAMEMPAGLAGLVIAGVFAAAMSSLDSSMHSIATAVTTDFNARFFPNRSEKDLLRFARWITVLLGLLGTVSALVLAGIEVKYLWDAFLGIMGLLLGTVGGLFTLGIISNRATGFHAWLGTLASIASLILISTRFKINTLMNSAIAVLVCVLVGWLSSLILPIGKPRVAGLTLRNRELQE